MAEYEEHLQNSVTGENYLLKSNDYLVFCSKKEKKLAQWDRENHKLLNNNEAEERTAQASRELEAYKSLLAATLSVDDRIDWEALKDNSAFPAFKSKPELGRLSYFSLVPQKGLWDLIPFRKGRRLKLEADAENRYSSARDAHLLEENKRRQVHEDERAKFLSKKNEHNGKLETLKSDYESLTLHGVKRYIDTVLERSKYPDSLELFSETHYDAASKCMVIDLDLPRVETLPTSYEFKYSTAKKEITEKKLSKKEQESLYDDVLHQIAIRTIHEVVEADYVHAVEVIVLNGWIDGIDRKTGADIRNCIMTVQTTAEEFRKLNLARIDPKECFKHLKGVSAGALVNLAPVKPIMVMNTADGRIIKAAEILSGLDADTNLATMDWQEFEVLVRDLIQKEFAREGCKVEVTRASRDAGVDALAFDEDPIRGGKYIIQAKRYNNLVPVSAVRELYGTSLNEGAVKGILITTSHYGKDALEFAKDKPLTLINGEQLIYMFNKHGFDFKIELQKKQKAASYQNY